MLVRDLLRKELGVAEISPTLLAKELGVSRQATSELLMRSLDSVTMGTLKKYTNAIGIKIRISKA